MDPNAFDAYRPLLSSETLRDIESLHPEECGFGREECAGPGVPAKLRGSMALKEHIFYVSSMPHTQWSSKLENVPKFSSFSQLVKSCYSVTDINCNNDNKDDHHHTHHHGGGGEKKKGNSTIPACNLAYSPDCSSEEQEYILRIHEATRASPDAVKGKIKQHSSNTGQFAITRYPCWKGEEGGEEEDGALQRKKKSSLPWVVRAVPTLNGEGPSTHAREEDAGEGSAVRGLDDIDDRKPNIVAEGEKDLSSEYFIFVCAHLLRDKRCGFCGVVLVDLLSRCIREETEKRQGGTATTQHNLGNHNVHDHDRHTARATSCAAASTPPPRITVFPCSHVGGHVYAGNVLVYSRFGGVAFGLFRPQDVVPLVTALLEDKGEVPPSLVERVRGHIGDAYVHLE